MAQYDSNDRLPTLGAMAVILLTGCSPQPSEENWGECILNKMPGAQNNFAAGAIIKSCTEQFGSPNWQVMKPGNPDQYSSGDQCVINKAKATSSELGARVIAATCHKLFDKPDETIAP